MEKLELDKLDDTAIIKILQFNRKVNYNNLSEEEKQLVLSTFKIENKYKKFRVELNNLKVKFFEIDPWLTAEELSVLIQEKYSENQTLKTLTENLANFFNFLDEIRLKSLNLILKDKNSFLLNEDFSKKNPLDSKYIKKMMLNKISLELFNKKCGFKIKMIEKKEKFPEDTKHSFIYFSSIPIEEIKLSRFNYIIDANGRKIELEKVYQSNDVFNVLVEINQKMVKLSSHLYFGMIICKS